MNDMPLAAYALELARDLQEQRALNVRLAERLAACAEVLGRAAERGKVCRCCENDRAAAPAK